MYERYERYFKIELYPFTKNFFRKTFVRYVTVCWLVWIWTYKNADKKNGKTNENGRKMDTV